MIRYRSKWIGVIKFVALIIVICGLTIILIGCISAKQVATPETIAEAQEQFDQAIIEHVTSDKCVPPKIQKAYDRLSELVWEYDNEQIINEFIVTTEQEYFRWQRLCVER